MLDFSSCSIICHHNYRHMLCSIWTGLDCILCNYQVRYFKWCYLFNFGCMRVSRVHINCNKFWPDELTHFLLSFVWYNSNKYDGIYSQIFFKFRPQTRFIIGICNLFYRNILRLTKYASFFYRRNCWIILINFIYAFFISKSSSWIWCLGICFELGNAFNYLIFCII